MLKLQLLSSLPEGNFMSFPIVV
uniref:Agamous-like MADS-box protein AGL19 n=1 Tax=Rhizophora mucronata TaxID=61149 RepID=A0A2P2PVZ1_RHIMU